MARRKFAIGRVVDCDASLAPTSRRRRSFRLTFAARRAGYGSQSPLGEFAARVAVGLASFVGVSAESAYASLSRARRATERPI
jgi:hypothetical protein